MEMPISTNTAPPLPAILGQVKVPTVHVIPHKQEFLYRSLETAYMLRLTLPAHNFVEDGPYMAWSNTRFLASKDSIPASGIRPILGLQGSIQGEQNLAHNSHHYVYPAWAQPVSLPGIAKKYLFYKT
ncbi:hypothetical protein PtrSN002B_012197 [Pyrenophora tritici-repentis]|nr:hypothetical protein PtrSN002B_012197 [Pyrenophora tritici-repentis]